MPRTLKCADVDIVAGGLYSVHGAHAIVMFVYIVDPEGTYIPDSVHGCLWEFGPETGCAADDVEDLAVSVFNELVDSISCGQLDSIAGLYQFLDEYGFGVIDN